ncbi:Uncharacterized protein TCM_042144 [Theobroma cacao]|uniref:RNase H type-1 domain-containing protein n=1 Tax=Theobroma cacao TaxID=3641 RepID=A0A061GX77_THECC|nr:Uncharacterized protein TCM_042144 [Theobroma cacao]
MWVNAGWNDNADSITDLYRFLAVGISQQRNGNTRPLTIWERPRAGTVKFNVDGVVDGCPVKRGLVDYLGMKTEREAFILFSNSVWASSHSLSIESDPQNVIRWIKEPSKTPWRLRKWMLHIEVLKKRVNDWQIRHTLREGNKGADLLAKEGVGREVDLVELYYPR